MLLFFKIEILLDFEGLSPTTEQRITNDESDFFSPRIFDIE